MYLPLRSELTKAVTSPSVVVTAVAAFLVPPILAAVTAANSGPPGSSPGFDIAAFGQPLVIVLAALIAGTEFMDAQLRTTLLATPRRGRALAAKLIVVAFFAAVVGLVATSLAAVVSWFTLGQRGLPPAHLTANLGCNLAGVALNYTLMSLIAASLAILTRGVIAPLIVLIPMVLGLTIGLVQAIPALKYLPDLAGLQLFSPRPGMNLLEPLPGALVMTSWAVALVVASTVTLCQRDTSG